jgi:hypothetical protein
MEDTRKSWFPWYINNNALKYDHSTKQTSDGYKYSVMGSKRTRHDWPSLCVNEKCRTAPNIKQLGQCWAAQSSAIDFLPATVNGLNNFTVTGRQYQLHFNSIIALFFYEQRIIAYKLTLYGKGWVFSLAPLGSVGCSSSPSQARSGTTSVRSDQSAYLVISESKDSYAVWLL